MERERRSKRLTGISKLRPDVVLHGEEHPNGESIRRIAESDLRKRSDLILTVKTCLKVLGAKGLVRELCHAAETLGGTTVWINKEAPPSGLAFTSDTRTIAMTVILCYLTESFCESSYSSKGRSGHLLASLSEGIFHLR